MMKNRFLITVLPVLLCCLQAPAQTRDVSLTGGVYVPMYNGSDSSLLLGAGYGQFFSSGLGFRAGLQYAPQVAGVEDHFGLPLALAWRTKARSTGARLRSGAQGASGAVATSDPRSVLGSFLLNLFSDLEFHAGVTPVWISGASSFRSTYYFYGGAPTTHWTEKRSPVSMTLDAGMCFNYSIWRFDIRLSPTFHFDPFGKLVRHSETELANGVSLTETPLRWFFSFSGGLAFRF